MTDQTDRPDPTVVTLSRTVQRLRAELDGLRDAMAHRSVIEQAKGIVMARSGVGPDEAFAALSRESQRRNVRLARVAASVVASVSGDLVDRVTSAEAAAAEEAPPAPGPDLAARLADIVTSAGQPAGLGAADPQAGEPVSPTGPEAAHHLTRAAVQTAEDADAVAAALLHWHSDGDRVARSALFLLQPDGALSMVGAAGLTALERSRFRRIPPSMELPITAAVRERGPVWCGDAAQLGERFEGLSVLGGEDDGVEALAALPLMLDGEVVGAMSVGWKSAQDFEPGARTALVTLADVVARQLAAVVGPEDLSGRAIDPLLAVLDVVMDPAIGLVPVTDPGSGEIVDFRIAYANQAALDATRVLTDRYVGSRLLELTPRSATSTLLDTYRRCLQDRRPVRLELSFADDLEDRASPLTAVAALPVRDWVVATWRIQGDQDVALQVYREAEAACRTGGFWWDLPTGRTTWTRGTYRLLGREPAAGPVSLDDALHLVHPDDVPALRAAVQQVVGEGRPALVQVRWTGYADGSQRLLQLRMRLVRDPGGQPRALVGGVVDVSTVAPRARR